MRQLIETYDSSHDDRGVDIRVLGPLEVTVRNQPIGLGGPRASRVLALLATNCGTVVPRDWIVDVLWDDPPSSARQQVHNVIHALRRVLTQADARANLTLTEGGYVLHTDGIGVDAVRFRNHLRGARIAAARGDRGEAADHLRHALAQWRGPALAGLASGRLAPIATLLDDERIAAVEQLAQLRLAAGESAAVTGELVRLVAEHPLRESLRAVLMKALYQDGRRAEAITCYEQGRRLLAEDLGLDPSPVLRAAHQYVLSGAPVPGGVASGGRTSGAPVRPAEATIPTIRTAPGPNFLPRDLPEFTGRAGEVARLTDLARRAGTTSGGTMATAPGLVTINGMAGVGKTALAVHTAHALADTCAAGQYYVDLKGFDPSHRPLDPAQALDLLLRDLGIPVADIPPSLDGRSALWRSRLADRRVVVLVDNAVGPAQVRPLLPGSRQAVVLVSSRTRLSALEGSVPLHLDVMPTSDGVQLFSRIVGVDYEPAEREAVTEIVELCEGLPLAIGIAAARLRDRPHWTVAHVVDQLRHLSHPRLLVAGDRDVVDSIRLSLTAVAPRAQRLLSLISRRCASGFDVGRAAALSGLRPDDAAACLEELGEANLVRQDVRGCYRVHRLVRISTLMLMAEPADRHRLRTLKLAVPRSGADYGFGAGTGRNGAVGGRSTSS
jgi:DNA-binding SARP family transcriptional activator